MFAKCTLICAWCDQWVLERSVRMHKKIGCECMENNALIFVTFPNRVAPTDGGRVVDRVCSTNFWFGGAGATSGALVVVHINDDEGPPDDWPSSRSNGAFVPTHPLTAMSKIKLLANRQIPTLWITWLDMSSFALYCTLTHTYNLEIR